MAKTIKITINPEGKKTVETSGFQGVGCAAVVDAFTKGDKVTSTIKKPEYHKKTLNTVCQ